MERAVDADQVGLVGGEQRRQQGPSLVVAVVVVAVHVAAVVAVAAADTEGFGRVVVHASLLLVAGPWLLSAPALLVFADVVPPMRPMGRADSVQRVVDK